MHIIVFIIIIIVVVFFNIEYISSVQLNSKWTIKAEAESAYICNKGKIVTYEVYQSTSHHLHFKAHIPAEQNLG